MAELNYHYILMLNIFQKYFTFNKQLLTDYLTRKRKSISMKKKFENVIRFYMMLFSSFEKFTLEGNIFSYFDSHSDFIF